MKRKTSLTMERHKEIGAELYKMRDALLPLTVEMSYAYSVNGKELLWLKRAVSSIDHLRCCLEDRMMEDYPDASLHVYYPGGLTAPPGEKPAD